MENAPFFDKIAAGPVGGAAHWLNTSDGLRIRAGHWPHANAKGSVIIFPGRTEFIEKYGRTAQALHDGGYASLAIDWRGQGLADRMIADRSLGHVGRFTDYQKDVSAVIDHLKAIGLPQPWYLIGHSMGGCIGLRSLMEGLSVKATMFSAPMWGIQMAGPLRPIAFGVASVSKKLGFDHVLAPGQVRQSYLLRVEFKDNTLTNDEDMFNAMRAQLLALPALGLGGPSLRWLHEAMTEMNRLSLRPAPDLRCLTFLGGKEAIVDPERIRLRMADWPNGQLRFFPEGQHEMLMDSPTLRGKVLDETIRHFDAHS